MIDRFGRHIIVAWSEHHLVWIEAAMTLPINQRTAAYLDIADMTGRTLSSVRTKAYWIRSERKKLLRRAEAAAKARESLARFPLVVAGKLGMEKPIRLGAR